MPKTNLELVEACDSFPYDDPHNPQNSVLSAYYQLLLPADPRPHGLLLPSVVSAMPWTSDFTIDHSERTVQLRADPSDKEISTICMTVLSQLINKAIEANTFSILHGQHSELYSIVGAKYPVAIERFARSLFGIIGRGAHLTVYSHTEDGMKIWVPRRAAYLFTYPNCLDTTVAGGVTAGEGPFECIVREAAEEASLPEKLVRENAHSCGVLSYITKRESRGGGEEGLVSPDLIYIYDLEVQPDVILKPGDDEVGEFLLMDLDEVREALATREWKTNSVVVMIDFLMRHGAITPEEEKDYAELSARMHRRLPFPTTAR